MSLVKLNDDLGTAHDYPRPQLRRAKWTCLDGEWEFAEDPAEVGLSERWFVPDRSFEHRIIVPFPPGSALSGTEDFGDSDVVWYRRHINDEELANSGDGARHLLHFEGVDFQADVWVNGHHVATHTGGATPFAVELSHYLGEGGAIVVVRAEDRREDISQPRGKQDWREDTHGIWYRRSTGIWRDVWLERTPAAAIDHIWWSFDLDTACVTAEVAFSGWLPSGQLSIELEQAGRRLSTVTADVSGRSGRVRLEVPAVKNRAEWPSLLWAPGRPNLVDARVVLRTADGEDHVESYLGLREVDLESGYLRINRKPVYVRAVLDQGYWAESYFTAPSLEALHTDLRLAEQMGFNTVRVHQRSADRRYLGLADRMGLMVWDEYPAAFEFSRRAVQWTLDEWSALVDRDASHPSVVVWVPFNESWGVDLIESDPRQQHFVRAVTELTRAKDPSRPVIANDGWEQLDTDIVTTHDYATTGDELEVAYRDAEAVDETVHGVGPQGRRILLDPATRGDRPVMVSEFGGISLNVDDGNAWGYAVVKDAEAYDAVVGDLFEALYRSPVLTGFCYTQLADTGQETNGLLTASREPKLPVTRIRDIVQGDHHFTTQRRPRRINEVSATEE